MTDEPTQTSLSGMASEGVLSSTMRGAGESYLSAYVLYLNATAAEVGLLVTFPALLGSFAQVLARAGRSAAARAYHSSSRNSPHRGS
ncbi:MAG: hypothetical protein ACYCTF_13455 [Acidiferrobacter sp.]